MAWLGNWSKRIKLTIDSGDVDAALSDFPVLVYISASSGITSADVSAVFDELLLDANRKKIAITTSDGQTQCYVEIEKWDDANEQAWLWVKIPSVASGADTELYLYYDINQPGNDTYVGDTNSTPAENVWANGYFITHFKDDPDNTHIRDSSSYSSDGDKVAANRPQEVPGDKTSYAQDFNSGNPDYIEIPTSHTQLDFTSEKFSIIIRVYIDSIANSPTLLMRGVDSGSGYWFYVASNGRLYFNTNQTAARQRTRSAISQIAAATYYTLGMSRDGASVQLLKNGVAMPQESAVHINPLTSSINCYIGVRNNEITQPFDGKIEFLGIFGGVALTPAFHKAFDESITDDLLTFGEEELSSGVWIDRTKVVIEKASLVVENRIEERSIANFTIVDIPGTASYSKGQAVLIYDPNNVLIFGGVIDNPETLRVAPSGELLHPITCADYHYFADKRLVAESYESKTCGFIVDDIFDKYLALEGVTIGNIDLGATLVEARFNYVRVTDAYDALAEKAGFVWYIDENKALYFQARDTTAAPWTLTGDDIIKGSGRLSGGNPKYRNRQYIRGGKGTTSLQTETFTGDGVNVAFTVGYPIVKVPTITVNAVGQTVGIKGIDTAKDCYWSKGDPVIVFDAGSIPGAVAVVIAYYGEYDVLALAESPAEIAALQAIEGAGTGYVEDIADEPTLTDTDALLDSGEAKLARFGIPGLRFMFQTVRTGLKPGQLQTVNYPALSLSGDMLVESVITRVYTGNLIYDVMVIQGPESGSWAELFKSLANIKQEVIERLNVGTEQILIILISEAETWEWAEDVTETVYACTVVNGTVCGGATPVVC